MKLYLPQRFTSLSVISHYPRQIAIAAALLTLAFPMSAEAQERALRTLTVTGQGEEVIPTTIARVQLGVEIRGKTAAEVQQEVASRTSAVVNLLRSRNVAQLQTTGISLQPNYDYRNEQQNLIGYIGTNTVSFRVPTEKAGALMDESIQTGATRIDGVSFIAEDSAISAAQKQALREATQDAQSQADAVLSSLNLSRKDIVKIVINGQNVNPPIYLQNAMVRGEAASSPVIGGDQAVNASVTLEISY
ncbi:SIMPL domain-containing protein [Oscillatoria sp. FACHB-1406]|uniref:SIMPL domain-containing protein n=1 Tax=Oscillatoria sp. FACHB-1406 TaxID=2692846 RepID=UPI001688CD67|nr:SIMPL domain-containing protein [Oscillatoria sp. FACHB-1406]MBD2576206.1 SIMPL domain-containing protein [Oscillatoria sp. FACHB-1406]